MVKNPNKDEGKENLIILAKNLEEKAFSNAKKSNITNAVKEIGEIFEKAGDLRRDAGDIPGAEIDYIHAIRKGYQYKANKREEVEEKIESMKYDRFKASKKYGVGKNYLAFLSITFLVVALFSSVYSLTGYSISGLTEENFRFVGTGFFLLGLFFAFLYFKLKKN